MIQANAPREVRARPVCVPPPERLSTRPAYVPPPEWQRHGRPYGPAFSIGQRRVSPYGNHTSSSAYQGRAAEEDQDVGDVHWPSHGVWTPAQQAGYQAWLTASPEYQRCYSGSHSLPCKIDKAMSSGRLNIQTLKGIKTQVTDLDI